MNDLANYSRGLATPLEEDYVATQTTVDSAVELSHVVATSDESQPLPGQENERHDASHQESQFPLEGTQEQHLNETAYASFAEDHVRQAGYEASSQQILQANNISSQAAEFSAAPCHQYQYPSQSQGYPCYPPKSDFLDIGHPYSITFSQQYPHLPQYSQAMSQNHLFSTAPISNGQPPYPSPANAPTVYPTPTSSRRTTKAQKAETKNHHCPTCGKSFLRPSTLITHMRTHTGDAPFFCRVDGCGRGVEGKGFNVKSNCSRHEKRHQELRAFALTEQHSG